MRIALDTSILGKICHPKKNIDVANWFLNVLTKTDTEIFLPEICDYELRRELIRINSIKSLERLDKLGEQLRYVPIGTSHMRKASEFWAEARKMGVPSAAMEALDGDVILAAQALDIDALVVTENIKHLSNYVSAKNWYEVL